MITQRLMMNRWVAAILSMCAVYVCGCGARRTPAKPVVSFIAPVRPVMPAPHSSALQSPPDVSAKDLSLPGGIGAERLQPPRPHVANPEPAESSRAGKHVEPTIAPEVDTAELTQAKVETQKNLDAAEKNLQLAQGKALNATQTDLISKVRGFADNAREAMRTGDWVRAKNLSSKAQLLSEQLAASL